MTLGKHSESATAAYSKRKAQLERWQESETDKESVEIRNRPKRVKFADKCIFQAACASNDKAQVARMIKDGYNINAVDEDGITALHQACIEDNFDMVEFLLDNGADVNISDNEGWTPLHAVATCCYVSIAKLLLEHNANVVALNNDCSIPLDICKSDEIRELFKQAIAAKGIDLGEARKGEELKMIEDARRWLSTGVYEEQPHPITGATAMHVASCKGYIKVLDQLIKAGADLNGRDVDGWTPLHAAAHWGQEEACRVLLESGCDMSLKNNCDQNALDVADLCVVPVLEEFKKKHDVNKNLDPVIGKLNVLPLPPKKKNPRLVFDDSDVYSSNYLHPQKTTDFANCSSDQEEYDANEAEAEDTVGELPSSSESIIDSNPALAISSFSDYIIANDPASKAYTADERSNETQSNLDKGVNSGYSNASSRSIGDSVKGAKTSDLEKDSNTVPGQLTSTLAVPAGSSTGPRADGDAAGDDNTPAWRRGGSLRTKTPTSPLEDKDKASDRVTVRRTRSEASNDVNLRRAYSFESDSKFYSKLISARNRIKAIEAASAAMTANFLVNSHAQSLTDTTTTTTSTISPPVTTTSAISESTVLNPTDSIKGPMSNQTYNKASSNNNFEVVLRRKDTDSVRSAARPTTISTSSAQNRVAGGNGSVVQMRRSFVPPARDEESETQRKAHAKRVRETRRSTQGVTLEELKSAEQYVKAQQNTHTTPNEPPSGSQPSAPVPGAGSASTVLRKDEESLERRPSWRLRVDDSDRSKFSLEDTRSTVSSRGPPPSSSRNLVEPDQERVQHSPTTRSRSSRLESSFHGRPPRPPEESVEDKVVPPVGDEKEKENKISGAQGAIAKKKRPKRRSTGVVSYNADESEEHDDQLSDTEGSARGSDVETGPESSRSENGVVTRVNYRKLYEETLKENQQLKSRLSTMEEQLADLKLKADRASSHTQRIAPDTMDKREKRALEQKFREMEEELKNSRSLAAENQKLKDENGALIRVISKLSK